MDFMVAGDHDLLLTGCASFLRAVFGEENWCKWNEIRKQCESDDLRSFISWLLEAGEVLLEQQQQGQNVDCDVAHVAAKPEVVYREPGDIVEDVGPTAAAPLSSYESDAWQGEVDGVCHLSYGQNENEREAVFCGVCERHLSCGWKALSQHLRQYHPYQGADIACGFCSLVCHDLQHFCTSHMPLCRPPGSSTAPATARRIDCYYCGKQFKSQRARKEHVATQHEKTEPAYTCATCGRKFCRAAAMSMHRRQCGARAITNQHLTL